MKALGEAAGCSVPAKHDKIKADDSQNREEAT
jgi:hypothetical protein